jgi:hypothetical protein
MKPHEKQLMKDYHYMKCGNKTEFLQRLQWLSEGMLKNHLYPKDDGSYFTINKEEILLYNIYRSIYPRK